jgi:hypothetical protein
VSPSAKVVLAPPVLAFLPQYASLEDPVTELRSVVLDAVGWLGEDVTVLGDDQGRRVAAHLLAATSRTGGEPSYLVMGNGSARRTDSSPGPYDERAVAFDEELGRALRDGDVATLQGVDPRLARDLWAATDAISEMARLSSLSRARVDYDGAPFGVQYWVMRWASDAEGCGQPSPPRPSVA